MSHQHHDDESVNIKVALILMGVLVTVILIGLWS